MVLNLECHIFSVPASHNLASFLKKAQESAPVSKTGGLTPLQVQIRSSRCFGEIPAAGAFFS